jgi:predicted metal-dependent HD superfamily phosphohydrolase
VKKTLNAARWEALAARLGLGQPLNHPEATNPLVEYAIWFHDAIYNTFSKKNEARSADIAVRMFERQARNILAWGLEQLAFGRATFRWTARF